MSCSFKSIFGEECGTNSRDRNFKPVVPFKSCLKEITNHKKYLGFSGVETEVQLILARCGLFETPSNLDELTICPSHRSKLGIGWRRTSKLCSVVSRHGENLENRIPSSERGLNFLQSQKL